MIDRHPSWWLLAALLLGVVSAQTVTTTVTQLGSSGKFRVSNQDGENDPNAVTIEMDYCWEIPKLTGSGSHTVTTMANQDFTITNQGDVTYQGIAATQIDLESTLAVVDGSSTFGTIKIETYVIKEAGTITVDGTSQDVQINDVKFNIVLSNWSFQSGTTDVEVGMITKGRNNADADDATSSEVNVGGDVPLILFSAVNVDGTSKALSDSTPETTVSGNKYSTRFRFPFVSGDSTATYDPVLGYSCFTCPTVGTRVISVMRGMLRGVATEVNRFVGGDGGIWN